jgi:DNA helicase HerA-like ATPase
MEKDNDSILKVGTVIAVKGRTIEVAVDKMKNASHLLHNGNVIKNVSVGSYLKIAKGFSELIGKIESEFIQEDKLNLASNYSNSKNKIKRILVVTLVGFINSENNQKEFKQGLKELPLIENECYLLTEDEFELIHKFAKDSEDAIQIGTLLNETSVPIKLGVDRLFASHIGIFGNTGSGKSYSLAKIYHELFNKYKKEPKFRENAKFVLIDFNGEYAVKREEDDNIIMGESHKERIFLSKTGVVNKFKIPKKTIYDTTFWTILLKASDQTQKPFLESSIKKDSFVIKNLSQEDDIKKLIIERLILLITQPTKNQDKKFHLSFLEELLKEDGHLIFKGLIDLKKDYQNNLKMFDSSIYYFNGESVKSTYENSKPEEFIKNIIEDKVNALNIDIKHIDEFNKIRLSIILNYYYNISKGFYSKDNLSPLIGRLNHRFSEITKVFEIDDKDSNIFDKNLTIISLHDVKVEMKKIIPLVICKYYYDYFKDKNVERKKYLNLIIDEAHNILSKSSTRESESWKDYRLETFEEIIKEGRKFGVFLTIASQRPSDISDTIISQLHNYFLHRLINNKDIEAIGRTVSYLDKVSFESLSILPQGACILAGLSADLPVVIKVDKIDEDYKPYNETIQLTKHWKDEN